MRSIEKEDDASPREAGGLGLYRISPEPGVLGLLAAGGAGGGTG